MTTTKIRFFARRALSMEDIPFFTDNRIEAALRALEPDPEPDPPMPPEPRPWSEPGRIPNAVQVEATSKFAVRFYAAGRLVNFHAKALNLCGLHSVRVEDVATRIGLVPHLWARERTGSNHRTFQGADGLMARAIPWRRGWIVTSVWRRKNPSLEDE